MNDGKKPAAIPQETLWEDYFENLHGAYNSMRTRFSQCAGLTQDHLAALLKVSKSLISKRLNGDENLTLKTLSSMATAMGCRLLIVFQPYSLIGLEGNVDSTPLHAIASAVQVGITTDLGEPSSPNAARVLDQADA